MILTFGIDVMIGLVLSALSSSLPSTSVNVLIIYRSIHVTWAWYGGPSCFQRRVTIVWNLSDPIHLFCRDWGREGGGGRLTFTPDLTKYIQVMFQYQNIRGEPTVTSTI